MKIIKKICFSVCILVIGFTTVITFIEASSIIFNPNIITAQVGQTFTLPIVIDGAESQNYTVRISLNFSPELLEVTSFSFGPSWMMVSQPRYDDIDNQQGQLIKTAGFPKGFSSSVLFGTVTFKVKGQGDSAIFVDTKTFVLDAENKSTLESRPQVRVITTDKVITPASSIEPLPNLPIEQTNLFDVNIAPAQNANRLGATFFMLFFIVAITLGIVGRIIFIKIRRRSLMQKIKHDKDIKN